MQNTLLARIDLPPALAARLAAIAEQRRSRPQLRFIGGADAVVEALERIPVVGRCGERS